MSVSPLTTSWGPTCMNLIPILEVNRQPDTSWLAGMIYGSLGFRILPRGKPFVSKGLQNTPKRQDAMICSNYIVQTVYCETFFKVSWKTSTLILWSPGLPGSRGITCKSDGFGRKPVGSENACHFLWARKSLENMIFLKTWWKPAGLAPSIAPGNEVSDLQGLQQKNPQVYKSKFKHHRTFTTKKTRSPLILDKKKHTPLPPPKKKNAAKTKKTRRKLWRKIRTSSKHPQIQ